MVYEYDGNGNITRAGDKVFTYDSVIKDRLMSVDGKAITYSESNPLNPKTYDGKTFEFEGRRLVKVSSGSMVATYQYDDTGLRTEKTVTKNGVATTTKFVYNGGKLITEYTGTKRVDYLYDENGMLYGFIYNNAKYFYIRDTLQNILGIVDANGNAVVHYNYTAYGECKAITGSKASTIGTINSFRYKGYYFDAETEFFYCNARYYSPEFCRFISPDSAQYLEPENVNGMNLYAYCGNDPVNYVDPSGHMPKWAAWVISGAAIVAGIALCATGAGGIIGGVLIGAGAGSLINGYVAEANGGDFTAGYIGGAISGALCGVGSGLGGMAFVAASETANLACFGCLALGVTASFTGGFAGNLAGTAYTSWHNTGFKSIDISWGETLATSTMMGALNIFAGMGSGMSTIAGNLAKTATCANSKFALRLVAGLIAGGTEAAYDLTSYLLGKLTSNF